VPSSMSRDSPVRVTAASITTDSVPSSMSRDSPVRTIF